MRHLNPRHLLGWAGLAAVAAFAVKVDFVPQSWPTIAAGIWLLYLLQKGLGNLSQFIIFQAGAFFISAFAFITLVQLIEPTFSGWADVFFFCGKNFEFCNCNLSWNLLGWYKAFVLWLFTLTTAVGFRNLLSQMVFGGLLPGEEYIDHEALQTVFIRLIPYWFNNWEQQWGVECSSLLFELPHFAIELLVILPMVQVMCRRLRPLVATRVRIPTPLASMLASHGIPVEVPYQPAEHDHDPATEQPAHTHLNPLATAQTPEAALKPGKGSRKPAPDMHIPIKSATDILALDASRGEWVLDARQQRLLPRLQSNIGSVAVCFALLATAVVNVLTMPLLLDTAVFTHPRAQIVLLASEDPSISSGHLQPWDHLLGEGLVPAFTLTEPLETEVHNGTCPHPHSHFSALELQSAFLHGRPHMRQRPCSAYAVTERRSPWLPDRKSSQQVLNAAMRKNSQELTKMRSWKHRRLVIAIELLLVAMRLSCEGFPVLFATYAAYILRSPAPLLSAVVRTVSSASYVLQCSLYLFPAICWAYGAGVLFSMFVSVVFWAAPLWSAYEYVASTIFVVAPLVVAKPGPELMERAGPQCAICWSTFEMGNSDVLPGGSSRGVSPRIAETEPDAVSGVGVEAQGSGEVEAAPEDSGLVVSDEISGILNPDAGHQSPPQPQRQKRRRRWFSLVRRPSHESEGDSEGGSATASMPDLAPDAAALPPAEVGAGAAALPPLVRDTSSGSHAASLHALGAAGSTPRVPPARGSSRGVLPPPHVGASETSLLNHNADISPTSSSALLTGAASPSHSDLGFGSTPASSGTPLAGLREPGDGWDGLADPISASTCERETVVCTKCRHVFHFGCLSHWLHQCMVGMRATVCPLCQRTIDVDVVINPMMLFRKGHHLDGGPPLDEGGEGLDESDDEDVPGGEANASYATVDFLRGLMPPPGALHLAHYPSANPQPPPVPFVTRLNHDARLLCTLQGNSPLNRAEGGARPAEVTPPVDGAAQVFARRPEIEDAAQ